ncbi:MAG: pyridoxal-phosphate dependent enzyme, partial [Bacteroidales bacterium]|nr:pyridoxal-phosphate dependent enzyme [Bacteroidales bacterium]
MIIGSIPGLIGNTPLVRLDKLSGQGINLYGKLEFINPGGSVKDRAALQI